MNKTEAENWANNIFSAPKEEIDDFLEYMKFETIGYHIDAEGNKRKLTQEEVYLLNSDPNAVVTRMSLEEYLKSREKQ